MRKNLYVLFATFIFASLILSIFATSSFPGTGVGRVTRINPLGNAVYFQIEDDNCDKAANNKYYFITSDNSNVSPEFVNRTLALLCAPSQLMRFFRQKIG